MTQARLSRTAQSEEVIKELFEIAPYLSDDNRDDLGTFLHYFQDDLPTMTEISISPHDESVGVMTRGTGEDFVESVREFLAEAGMNEESIDTFNRVEKYFPDINLLIKRDFYPNEKFKFTLYWQYLIPLQMLYRLARRFQVTPETVKFFREASLLLQGRSVFIGMGFSPPDKVGFKIFFTNHHRKSLQFIAPALSALLAKIGIGAEKINYFIGFHNFLNQVATGSVFTSLGFARELLPVVKVDYEIIPAQHAVQVMNALQAEPRQVERLKQVMDILRMRRLTYLGIKFQKGKMPRAKFYFDRRYSEKNSDNPEILADFLMNTIWTP